MNLSENTFSKDQANLQEQEYVPQQLKIPLVKDFMQIVRDELVGKNVCVRTNSGVVFDNELSDVFMNSSQMILKLEQYYVPWNSVAFLKVKS